MAPDKIIIVPGNGSGDVRSSNWYGWMEAKLLSKGYKVALEDMPDPVRARENKWVPFIVSTLAGGPKELEQCLVVGHSSGAAAAMRLAETHRLYGMVLVAAYTSDLGDQLEAQSGYFSRPWQWEKQAANAGCIVQLASTDDPFLPIEEQRKVGLQGLKDRCKYVEKDGRSHWFNPCKELMEEVEWAIENGGGANPATAASPYDLQGRVSGAAAGTP
eukprot:CAMPEP_0117665778 /NCGR_PEP_ID=MMETSP0804-20121206/10002_1 /TAXON_ID=1074897 /ORGANISM="Tetraselmis astigmatica, Strain CCMP880" /LENGTH=215 /DNA_ID=CAMNT_0005473235 /DNA_START=521 /DNA_END=1169 /DNA_ORIENTATION=+